MPGCRNRWASRDPVLSVHEFDLFMNRFGFIAPVPMSRIAHRVESLLPAAAETTQSFSDREAERTNFDRVRSDGLD